MGINKFLFLLSVAASGVLLSGNTYYVDAENGNDSADGSAEHPRILDINEFTRTIDATRHPGVGGNLENFPRRAITMGMKQCIEARKILIMTRNESTAFNWANTIIRIAALGKPGDDYPVTHMRNHRHLRIVTDRNTLKTPKFNI